MNMRFFAALALVLFLLSTSVRAERLAVFMCVSKGLRVSAKEVAPAASLTINGTGFWKECKDTGRQASPPLKGIKILFVQGSKTTKLGQVDANEKLEFSITVAIPKDAKAGEALIVAEAKDRTPVKVTVIAGK
jgi:hypothetical protein